MRTIIDLPEEQVAYLARFCKQEGISRAEAIRQAVNQMLEKRASPSIHEAANSIFGIWKDRDDIGDSVEYQRKLRGEWDREWTD